MDAALAGGQVVRPVRCGECGGCEWLANVCGPALKADSGHVSLLSGIGPRDAKRLEQAGIVTRQDLALIDLRVADVLVTTDPPNGSVIYRGPHLGEGRGRIPGGQMLKRIRRSPIVIAVAAALFGAGLFAGGAAYAGGGFSDTTPFFEDEINWLADNGIANGFADNTFRGAENITRNQAALWFANANRNIATNSVTADPSANTDFALEAPCPGKGMRPIAGGGATNTSGMFITDSQPTLTGGWLVQWETDGSLVDPSSISVFVTCVPIDAVE